MSLTRESAYATHAIAAATRANGSHRVSIKELFASTPKDRSATPSTAVDDGLAESAGFVAPLVARDSTSRVSPGGVAYLTKLLIKITMSAGWFDAALHPRRGTDRYPATSKQTVESARTFSSHLCPGSGCSSLLCRRACRSRSLSRSTSPFFR